MPILEVNNLQKIYTIRFGGNNRIIVLMGLLDIKLYALCAAGCFAGFAVLYIVIYKFTARVYYSIVKNQGEM